MPDKPIREKENEGLDEKRNYNSSHLNHLDDHNSHAILHGEHARQAASLDSLHDDLGHKVFPSSQQLLSHMHHPDSDEARVHRIEQWGQRRGSSDLGTVAAMDQAANAKTAPEMRQSIDMIQKASAVGEERTERLGNLLIKRHGDPEQEHGIREQIQGVKALKLSGLQSSEQEETRKEGDKSEKAAVDKAAAEKTEQNDKAKKDQQELNKLEGKDENGKVLWALNEDAKKNGGDAGKNFADWAENRTKVTELGDKNTAEHAMDSIIDKARDGSPSARNTLAATLVSTAGADAWLIAMRSDANGVNRSITIPNLPPEMSTSLKNEAAKGLISAGDVSPLSRGEHMALAGAMGEALMDRLDGNRSRENDNLIKTTADHFRKTLSLDPSRGRTEAEKAQMADKVWRATSGMLDAIKARVPGSECLVDFIDELMTDAAIATVLSDQIGKHQKERNEKRKKRRRQIGRGGVHGDPADFIEKRIAGDKGEKNKHAEGPDKENISLNEFLNFIDNLRLKLVGLGFTKGDRASFKVGERNSYMELESGRLYDANLNRFFVREGDKYVEDKKGATEQERAEIKDMMTGDEKDKDPITMPVVPVQPTPVSTSAPAN